MSSCLTDFSFLVSFCASPLPLRGALSPGARRGVRLHVALRLRPLHPHRALGGAGGQSLHQLCQERLLRHRHLSHQAFLRREGAQVSVCSFALPACRHTLHLTLTADIKGRLIFSIIYFHSFRRWCDGMIRVINVANVGHLFVGYQADYVTHCSCDRGSSWTTAALELDHSPYYRGLDTANIFRDFI